MTRKNRSPADWRNNELHQFLMKVFPGHRTILRHLDVQRLANETKTSHETVYKWLRTGKLTTTGAKGIVDAAKLPANAELLAQQPEPMTPPELTDLIRFVF